MNLIQKLWCRAKQWRKLSLGPLALYFRAGRNVRVSQSRLARGAWAVEGRTSHAIPRLALGAAP
ncbi:MAG TPA: hypothetical protein VFZ93_02495, partial [Albitalea sp.]